MSGKAFALAAALLLAGAAPAPVPQTRGAALAAACEGRDGWSDPAPPARIFGNTYYVGTCGISVLLVTSPKGHVLIDGATAEAVPAILANIRALGFKPRDVKMIVGSHEHIDHMGGFAALKAATGAAILVREPARPVLESGKPDVGDPQAGILSDMAPVKVDKTIREAGELGYFQVGGFRLDAVATPGHTAGGTSWTWRECEKRRCLTFAYVDSLTAIARDGYRFTDHPERVAPFRATFARVAAMKCDILVTPHPGFSNLFERLAGRAPLVYPDACKGLATAMALRLDARLAKEAAQ